MKKEIILVDGFNIFGKGLQLLIERGDEFNVRVASSSEELFLLLDVQKPDVVIINLLLPRAEVVSICKKINTEHARLNFIVIAAKDDEYTVLECVFNGAKGVIWSDTTSEELTEAIKKVISGDRYLKIPESQILKQVVQHAYEKHWDESKLHELSSREEEVLKLFVKGLSYKEIAANLTISPRTVESHKNNILSKLELSSVNEMIKYAIKHGLIEF